jgi:hypothetical protein
VNRVYSCQWHVWCFPDSTEYVYILVYYKLRESCTKCHKPDRQNNTIKTYTKCNSSVIRMKMSWKCHSKILSCVFVKWNPLYDLKISVLHISSWLIVAQLYPWREQIYKY